jgi:membrane fusion protein, multidrug efflux system
MLMKTDKKRKTIIITVSIIVILVLIKVLFFNGSKAASIARGESGRGQAMQVNFIVAEPETLRSIATAVGTVLSNEAIEVRSEISGKVEKIYFSEGNRVSKNDPLLKVNDDELQARLLSAKYRKELAEKEVARQDQLYKDKLVSEREYETAVNGLNVIKAEIQLDSAQIAKTEICAPFDGVIGLRYVSEGSYLSPSTLITTLQDNNTVKIDFTLPEKYAEDLKVGDEIRFTIQELPQIFRGSVYAKSPNIDPETRTLRVRARHTNVTGAVRAGSFAQVEVRMHERMGITVPSFTVIPELKRNKVFVMRNGHAEEKVITLGTRLADRIEITSGLTRGDTIISSAILQLRPGMAVNPIGKK